MKRRKKRLSWALYENLRKIERRKASGWKRIGRKPYDARALTVVTMWQEIEGKSERAYTAGL